MPLGLVADERPGSQSPPELDLDQILAKHNLALVPRSDLSEALTELNGLLKKNQALQALQARALNTRATNQTTSSGSTSGSSSSASRPQQASLLSDLTGGLSGGTSGLSDLLSVGKDIASLLKTLDTILTPEFLSALHDVVINLDTTLKTPVPSQIRKLLNNALPLVELLGKLNLDKVVQQIGDIDLGGLIKPLMSLLTQKNIENISTLLSNGAGLLTSGFVNETQSLFKEVSPLVDLLKGLNLNSQVKSLDPLLQNLPTIVNGAVTLLGNDTVSDIKTLLKGASPLIESLSKADLSKLFDQLGPILKQVGDLDLAEIIKSVKPLLTNAESLLTKDFVNNTQSLVAGAGPLLSGFKDLDLKSLVDQVGPLLKELSKLDLAELIKSVQPLLTNAESLLTKDFVNNTQSLVAGAGPLLSGFKDLDLKSLVDQ
ncbi:hypothetical protein E4U61_006373, partial [Claviceps capensis]